MPNSPAEDTENEVHDKEGTEDDHGDEVRELPLVPHGILDLCSRDGWGPREGGEKGEKDTITDEIKAVSQETD